MIIQFIENGYLRTSEANDSFNRYFAFNLSNVRISMHDSLITAEPKTSPELHTDHARGFPSTHSSPHNTSNYSRANTALRIYFATYVKHTRRYTRVAEVGSVSDNGTRFRIPTTAIVGFRIIICALNMQNFVHRRRHINQSWRAFCVCQRRLCET